MEETNQLGSLMTDLTTIVGRTVKRIHRIDSEVNRQADHYVIIECEGGDRFILSVAKLTLPCPNPQITLEEAAKDDGAFTVREALLRSRGEPLGAKGQTKTKAQPDDVSQEKARGVERRPTDD